MKLSLSLLILCASARSAVAAAIPANSTIVPSGNPIPCYVGASFVNASLTNLSAAPVGLLNSPTLNTTSYGYGICASYTFACDATTATIFPAICTNLTFGTIITKFEGYATNLQLNNRLAAMAPVNAAQDLIYFRFCNAAGGCNAPAYTCGFQTFGSPTAVTYIASPTFISCTVGFVGTGGQLSNSAFTPLTASPVAPINEFLYCGSLTANCTTAMSTSTGIGNFSAGCTVGQNISIYFGTSSSEVCTSKVVSGGSTSSSCSFDVAGTANCNDPWMCANMTASSTPLLCAYGVTGNVTLGASPASVGGNSADSWSYCLSTSYTCTNTSIVPGLGAACTPGAQLTLYNGAGRRLCVNTMMNLPNTSVCVSASNCNAPPPPPKSHTLTASSSRPRRLAAAALRIHPCRRRQLGGLLRRHPLGLHGCHVWHDGGLLFQSHLGRVSERQRL